MSTLDGHPVPCKPEPCATSTGPPASTGTLTTCWHAAKSTSIAWNWCPITPTRSAEPTAALKLMPLRSSPVSAPQTVKLPAVHTYGDWVAWTRPVATAPPRGCAAVTRFATISLDFLATAEVPSRLKRASRRIRSRRRISAPWCAARNRGGQFGGRSAVRLLSHLPQVLL